MSKESEIQVEVDAPSPVWQRYRVVVEVDVLEMDKMGYAYYVGAKELARAVVEKLLTDSDEMIVDGDGTIVLTPDDKGSYFETWHNQVRIRMPAQVEKSR